MLREMPPDPVATLGWLIKCIACVAILTLGIADFAGSGSYPVRGTESTSEGTRAAAHRKSLFEERRERFNGFAPERLSANSQSQAKAEDAR